MAERLLGFSWLLPFPHPNIKKKKVQERYIGTYLFNGICSNGPEVGIVPHKSLLETSLK